jgi:hypothetical protein
MFNYSFSESRAVYAIMWKKYFRAGQATEDNMAHACWITKAAETHSEYLMLIPPPPPLQQWLSESIPILLYRHTGCLDELYII